MEHLNQLSGTVQQIELALLSTVKVVKCQELVEQCRNQGQQACHKIIIVGCQSFMRHSLHKLLSEVRVIGTTKKMAITSITESAEKATKRLWIKEGRPVVCCL